MRFLALLPYLVAAVAAVDVDDGLDVDWDLVLGMDPILPPDIPVVYKTHPKSKAVTSATKVYHPKAAAKAAAAAVIDTLKNNFSDPIILDIFGLAIPLAKRDSPQPTCVPQPAGAGPRPRPDTASAFVDYKDFSKAAVKAPIPSGYVRMFEDLKGSSNAYGYMGYTLLSSYDTATCASKCNTIRGCQSFNLYYERNPTVDPNDSSCSDPPSTTNIKCVFWGGPVNPANALNTGQWRNKFQVVIAGSNGYTNRTAARPAGYHKPEYQGPVAINAPPACPGRPSRLLQSNAFIATSFDIGLCAAACSEQAAWAQGRAGMRQCSFFDTYVLYKNGQPLAQYCAMYDEIWGNEYAVNSGYSNGDDRYTIGFGYTSWNITSAVAGNAECKVTGSSTLATVTSTSTSSGLASTIS